MSKRIRCLDLSGTPAEIGRSHGRECRSEIQFLIRERRRLLEERLPSGGIDRIADVCDGLWRYLDRRFESLSEELLATAEAAGVEPWELVLSGGYSDVADLLGVGRGPAQDGCTLGVSTRPRFLAGTWDSHPSAAAALILLRRLRTDGSGTLALTTAGWPAQQGVNSAGVAFAITNLTPRATRDAGIPYIAAVALLAGMRSPREFSAFATRAEFCSGHAYVALGSEGPATIVETTGAAVSITQVRGHGAKANHYAAGSALDDNGMYGNLPNSCEREREMHHILPSIGSPIDFSLSLSRARYANRSVGEIVTCAYFFLNPVNRELWYQIGPARDGRMQRTSL